MRKITIATFVLLLVSGNSWTSEGEPEGANSLVKLHVTYQQCDMDSPWKTGREANRSGYGCILSKRKILTTADIIKDATVIKVEKNTTKIYWQAKVEFFDYDLNLALLTVEDKSFFEDLSPVLMEEIVYLDQPVKFLVFADSKEIRAIPGKIVQIAVDDYFLGWKDYLCYLASVNFEERGGGWSEPVFSKDKLVGINMSYNEDGQIAKIIPASVITWFLGGIRGKEYIGVPFLGIGATVMRSPDMISYLKMPRGREGIYVRSVFPRSSADGILQVGDVILAIDGKAIDSDSYYLHPEWGRLKYQDIVRNRYYPGDSLEVEILRDGKLLTKTMELKRFDQTKELIPDFDDRAQPQYLVVGGLVIQELNKSYLKEWGKDWQNLANKKYLYHYFYGEKDGLPGRQRFVIINKILPDEFNIGYQNLEDLVLVYVNGRPINKLKDVVLALQNPQRGYHQFELEGFNRKIILPVEGLDQANRRIATNYRIDKLQNFN